ncbi:kinase-like protein, partial [Clavulina sp. PMI_390]
QMLSWRQLGHANILKIIGVCQDFPYSHVAEYHAEGNVRDYLKKATDESRHVDFAKLLDGITAGIQYLHSRVPPVPHGDIRGQNIMIASDGTPLITDYGLARFQHNVQRSSTFHRDGKAVRLIRTRWTAPEISEDPDSSNSLVRSSLPSDIYSLGMTVFELMTELDPFSDMDDVVAIRTHVQRNGRPALPDGFAEKQAARAKYMALCEECWKQRPEDRATIEEVRKKLAEINAPPPPPPPASAIPATPFVKAEVGFHS